MPVWRRRLLLDDGLTAVHNEQDTVDAIDAITRCMDVRSYANE